MFKSCASVLAAPLTLIFQRSLDTEVFPERWKKAYITPIYKSGDNDNVKNYRPVSITSIVPKLLENLVSRQLYRVLSNVVNDNQHGFMKKRSTATNLISFTEYISHVLDDGGQVDVILTDFSKCFDKINHNLLISKLNALGVGGKLLLWLEDFHKNRKQIVRVNRQSNIAISKNYFSEEVDVTSGCIQGGHLSGILFLCFINDIVSILPPEVRGWLFADDFKIAIRVGGPREAAILQDTLDLLHSWCSENLMELNIEKCKIMNFYNKKNPYLYTYKINDIPLNRVDEVKDLGVTFQRNLKFNSHYNNINKKAFKMLGFLFRQTKDFTNPNTLKILYYAYVRSHLEYCSSVWSPQYSIHISSLEAVQRTFLRMLAYKLKTPIINHNYDEIMHSQDFVTLEYRRRMSDLTFLYKIINGQIYSPELLSNLNFRVRSANTRLTTMFKLHKRNTNTGEFSPLQRMQNIGNKVSSIDIFFCTLNDVVSVAHVELMH